MFEGCIAIPTTPREEGELALLAACWRLLSNGAPIANHLLITYSSERNPYLESRVLNLLRTLEIDLLFKSIEIAFLGIPPHEDIYVRHDQSHLGPLPRLGLKSGPNLQFFQTINAARSSPVCFLNETDVYPITENWHDQLNDCVDQDFWVLGSKYCGEGKLGDDIADHINGAAIYNTGDENFIRFCSEIWEPELENMCKSMPDTAYDIWLSRFRHHILETSLSANYQNGVITRAFDFHAKHKEVAVIANLTLPHDYRSTDILRTQGCALVHGKHFKLDALRYAVDLANATARPRLSYVQAMSVISRSRETVRVSQILSDSLSSVHKSKIDAYINKRDLRRESKLILAADASDDERHSSCVVPKPIKPHFLSIDTAVEIQPLTTLSDICIYTRSYAGDKTLLPEMYESIRVNFANAGEVVLVIEEDDIDEMKEFIPPWVKVFVEKKFAPGSIQHKYSKLTADNHSECKWFFHLDSDTVVEKPVDLEYLAIKGKPILEIAPYNELRKYQDSDHFREVMKPYVISNHLRSALYEELKSNVLPDILEEELLRHLAKTGVVDTSNWLSEHYENWKSEWFQTNYGWWFENWWSNYYPDWMSRDFDGWFEDWLLRWKYTFGLDVWQEGTSFAFGAPIEYEFSQKPIKLYPREIYPICRKHIEAVHKIPLLEFIKTRTGRQRYGVQRDQYFSDLNFIGACLYHYAYDAIHWIDTSKAGFDFRPTYFNQRISYDILS